MGLLKHVIFPLFGILHLNTVVQILILNNRDDLYLMWGRSQDDTSPYTKVELHLGAFVGGASVALLFGCIMAVLKEDSHFRGILLIMHVLLYLVDLYDSYKLETDGFVPLLVINAILLVSLLVHVNEPGIFTKSKTESGGSGNKKD